MPKLIRNKEGVLGFNCKECSAWNPGEPGGPILGFRFPGQSRLESNRFALPCASCGATHKVAFVTRGVTAAVAFYWKPYLCENCGKTTSSAKPRFQGTTAVLTCEHCGAETTRSISDLNKSAFALKVEDYRCENCGKTGWPAERPRFEGNTAVLTCKYCGTETNRPLLTEEQISASRMGDALKRMGLESAVEARFAPHLCENCGKTTSMRPPRFEGNTAVLTCEHCGAETTRSFSDLKKGAVGAELSQDELKRLGLKSN
jgi:uncharacterized Zn finger protein